MAGHEYYNSEKSRALTKTLTRSCLSSKFLFSLGGIAWSNANELPLKINRFVYCSTYAPICREIGLPTHPL